MLGYLLGRSGLDVLVLEKHADFLRDFRGDTIHPSTLELVGELGLLRDFLRCPHQRLERLKMVIEGNAVTIADFSRLRVTCPYVAFMPQWDFLNFVAEQGAAYPGFNLKKNSQALGLLTRAGRIVGVRVLTAAGEIQVEADLVVAADGRHSILREQSGLPLREIGAPLDVVWLRLKKSTHADPELFGHFGQGGLLITVDRGDYWQCAYIIPKGGFEHLKVQGLNAFKGCLVSLKPSLADDIDDLRSWDSCFLLTVAVNRLQRWWRPGLLCIGDAAHAMSPVGGVGINLAIQDAVAAANILVPGLAAGQGIDHLCARVQRRRELPVGLTQAWQVFVQKRILGHVLVNSGVVPGPLRFLRKLPMLQLILGRLVGLGVRPEHIRIRETGAG